MTKNIYQFIIVITVLILSSCKTNYGLRTYVYNNKINIDTVTDSNTHQNYYTHKLIVLINDSTLTYSVNLGHIGTGTTINYKIKNDILMVDTLDIHNKKDYQYLSHRIFGVNFIFYKDSLIDKNTREKYFFTKKKY